MLAALRSRRQELPLPRRPTDPAGAAHARAGRRRNRARDGGGQFIQLPPQRPRQRAQEGSHGRLGQGFLHHEGLQQHP
jgi:hypothetical protein